MEPVPRPPHTPGTRRLLIGAVAFAALLLGAYFLLTWRLEGLILHVARARTHREIRVDGEFEAHLLTSAPRLLARQVSIGNPPFMAAGEVAEVDTLVLTLRWQWTRPFLAIRRLEMRGASLHLVREADGRANWHQQASGPGAGPPLMESLLVPDARVDLDDERRHLRFQGTVSAADAPQASGPPTLRIAGHGELNGRAAQFQISGAPLALARRTDAYPFTFEEQSGSARLSGRGALEHAFDFRALHGSFAADGANLADLYYLVGLRAPQSGPFRLSGELARKDMQFEYHNLAATSGASDLAGSVSVDSSSGRAHIDAHLESQRLRLADLGAHTAAAASPEPRQLPDTPLRLSGLRRADAQIHYRARALEFGKQQLSDVTALVSISQGVLAVSKFSASTAGGRLEGHGQLDASGDVPRAALDLSASGIELDALPRARSDRAPLSGRLNARVEATGHGESLHELASSANGHVDAVIPQGAMRASLAELAGLEASGALGLLAHSQKETPIRCAVASLEAHEGTLTSRVLVVDTDKTLITGSGNVRLDTQALALTLHGRPKHPSLALHSDVAVGGTLSKPTVRLSGHGGAVQAGAAVALGVILTPVAAALAFINPGLAHDADCAALLAGAPTSPPAQ